jgi:hypothetical protein
MPTGAQSGASGLPSEGRDVIKGHQPRTWAGRHPFAPPDQHASGQSLPRGLPGHPIDRDWQCLLAGIFGEHGLSALDIYVDSVAGPERQIVEAHRHGLEKFVRNDGVDQLL